MRKVLRVLSSVGAKDSSLLIHMGVRQGSEGEKGPSQGLLPARRLLPLLPPRWETR